MKNINNPPIQRRNKAVDPNVLASSLADMTTVLKPTMSQTDIQNAINNSISKIIKFMAGTYNLSGITLTNVNVTGEGSDKTILNCPITFGSNVKIKDVKFGNSANPSTCINGATNIRVENCYITGGGGSGGFYINDMSVSNIHFVNCEVAFCQSTGLNLVDKSTPQKHIQDIYVESCYFHDNGSSNIGCISRQDGTNPVTSGYNNINLLNCRFEKPVSVSSAYDINVSFDSYELPTKNPSGTVTVRNCVFINGWYVFECAGATDLIFENNTLQQGSSTDRILSMSRLDNKYSNAIIKNNKFSGNGNVHVDGNDNIFENNIIDTTNGGLALDPGDNVKCRYNNIKAQQSVAITLSSVSNVFIENNIIRNSDNGTTQNSIVLSSCNGYVVSVINNIVNTKGSFIQLTSSTSEVVNTNNRNPKGNVIPTFYVGTTREGSIKSVQKYGASKFFTVTNNNLTAQSPMLLKCTWASRNNNVPAGDRFSASFNTTSSINALPALDKTGNVTVTVDTTSGNAVFTFTIVPTTNDSVLFDIEMLTVKSADWTIN